MKWFSMFLDLIFPRRCYICGDLLSVEEKYMCVECLSDLPLTYYWDRDQTPSDKRLWVRAYFERVIPLFFYAKESKYSSLIHRIKYNGDIGLGIYMGKLLGERLKGVVEVDYIIPIPLHRRRKLKRGFNQSEIISWGISDVLFGEGRRGERVVTSAIHRNRYTATQTKKGIDQKWSNVEGAFTLKNGKGLEGKAILLVDDVLTTGATLESAFSTLSQIEGVKVSVATLGFVE